MKKKPVSILPEAFPPALHFFFQDADIFDSSCSPGAQVLYSTRGLYLKTAPHASLRREAEITRCFAAIGLGVPVELYLSADRDYLITRSARGQDGTHFLDHPEKLCEALADAMRFLHSQPVGDLPVSSCMALYKNTPLQPDTLIHGDFCLPNIMLDAWQCTALIDLGQAGAGDRHIDLYWALWSLMYNLKTDRYSDRLLSHYGRELVDPERLRIVTAIESEQ